MTGGEENLDHDTALGVLELSSACAGVLAADVAIKCTEIYLGRLHLCSGIAGRAYLRLGGTQSDIQASMDAAVSAVGSRCLDWQVIARPHEDLDLNCLPRGSDLDPGN